MTTAATLLATLTEQHHHVKDLMHAVADGDTDRRAAFDEFRRFLAFHEAAEQVSIHPYRDRLGAESEVADQRLVEEDEAGEVLAELERMPLDSDEFLTTFRQLARAVVEHAEAEEHEELPLIDRLVGEDDLARIHDLLAQVPELAGQADRSAPFADLLQEATGQFTARF